MNAALNPRLRDGWPHPLQPVARAGSLDGWTRQRLSCVIWVQWKTRGNRYRELRRLKVSDKAAKPKGPRRLGSASAMHRVISNKCGAVCAVGGIAKLPGSRLTAATTAASLEPGRSRRHAGTVSGVVRLQQFAAPLFARPVTVAADRQHVSNHDVRVYIWRRGRDSNPRYPQGYNGFRDRPDRPLRHLSCDQAHAPVASEA
jgi:hypothetical protein